jgi:TatD DNase family protein
MFVDSHCHIDFPEFAERIPEVLANMRANGVTHALCISVNLRDWPRVLALAENHGNLFASVGVHPDHEPGEQEVTADDLLQRAAHPKVVGIGETGLDYYRLSGDLEWQRERFRTHIRAARACRKPLIVHTRAAAEDTIRLMREEGAAETSGVMHCFTETWDVARAALDLGFFISFSGIVTFKSATQLREVARNVPLDRLLVETDSPYLAPVPFRGKTNEPAYVKHVAEEVSRVKAVSLEALAAVTTENFFRLFRSAKEDNLFV